MSGAMRQAAPERLADRLEPVSLSGSGSCRAVRRRDLTP